MNPVAQGPWRLLRYSLLVLCAGGLLAADNSWITSVDSSLLNPSRWFWSASANDAAVLPAAVDAPVDISPDARLSMGGLLHGLLFDRPAGRWALDPRTPNSSSSLARRLVEFEQINSISGGNTFAAAFEMRTSWAPVVSAPSAAITNAPAEPVSPSAVTVTGSWSANASGTWSNPANWTGGIVADGAGNAAGFSTVNLTTDVTVTLDTSRTIGSVLIGDTDGTHRYTIAPSGGSTLTFDSGAPFPPALLQQTATSAGDTVSTNILLNSSLDIVNLSGTNPLTISGNIAGTAAPNDSLFVSTAGTVNISGAISDGALGGEVGLQVLSGVTTLTGTNTYSNFTSVDGTLLVNGDNSGATGAVFVSGTLGGTGKVGGDVHTFDGTITGGTTSTVGALTLTQDVNLATMEGSGTYLANLSGNMSDLLAITGELILGQGSILDIQGSADGITTYTLATFGSRDDVFATVMGVPSGYNLVYHDMDIQLVPIPEPSTWIGGALVLGALLFTHRRRFRRA